MNVAHIITWLDNAMVNLPWFTNPHIRASNRKKYRFRHQRELGHVWLQNPVCSLGAESQYGYEIRFTL